MLRTIARWWAKRQYIWKQEVEAGTNDLHAGLSLRLAAEKRALIEKLNKEADDIEANIKNVDAKLAAGFWECEKGHGAAKCSLRLCDEHEAMQCEECKTGEKDCAECGTKMELVSRGEMTGQEKYESDKERGEAEKIVASKRETAKAEEGNAEGSEKTAQYFKGQAANNRQVADKVRAL